MHGWEVGSAKGGLWLQSELNCCVVGAALMHDGLLVSTPQIPRVVYEYHTATSCNFGQQWPLGLLDSGVSLHALHLLQQHEDTCCANRCSSEFQETGLAMQDGCWKLSCGSCCFT